MLALAASAAWAQSLRWTNLSPTVPPGARRSSGGALVTFVATQEELFVIHGGFSTSGFLSDTALYVPSGNAWVSLVGTGGAPGARERHAMAFSPAQNRVALVHGGNGPFPYVFLDSVHLFDPVTQGWSQPPNPVQRPVARVDGKLEWVPELNAFLYFGGTGNVTGNIPRYNDLWTLKLLSDAGIQWDPVFPSGTPPSPRNAVCGAWVPDRRQLVFFGGETANGTMSAELWAYDLDSNAWLQLPNLNPPPARGFCGTAWDPRRRALFFHGGQEGSDPAPDSYAYDFDGGTWTRYPSDGGGPRALSDSAAAYSPALKGTLFFGGRLTTIPSSTYSSTLWLARFNGAPQPDGGPPFSVDEGAAVTVTSASATDPDGDALTFNWSLTSGPAAQLFNTTTLNPSFTAPRVTTPSVMHLTLAASDGVDVALSSLFITVNDTINEPPVADAGVDKVVNPGDPVSIPGGAVDPNGDAIVSWTWQQQTGPTVVFPGGQTLTFVAPQVTMNTILQFALTATDARGGADTDLVQIAVMAPIVDGGTSDGGGDAGTDAGTNGGTDGGAADGGADGGAPDGGAPDAGAPDAGTPDAGTPDAGAGDGGVAADAGSESDAGTGSETGPRRYGVGCGCGAGGGAPAWALLLFALARRRRPSGLKPPLRRGERKSACCSTPAPGCSSH